MRPAARLMRSASATDVPPNFMTTVPFKARQVRAACAALLLAASLASCGGGGKATADRHGPLPAPGTPELGLPLETAVAQLFAVGFAGTGPDAHVVRRLRTRDWGVVVLESSNVAGPLQARALTGAIAAAGRRHRRPPPLVLAASPETFPGVLLAPQPAQRTAPAAFRAARAAGRKLRAAGVDAVFAPEADLAVAAGPA